MSKGARAGLLAQVGELSALAATMAAAAIGLRGADAAKAMTRAKRERAALRWASVCEAASERRERIIQRDAQQLEQRVRLLLNQTDVQHASCAEEQGDISRSSGSIKPVMEIGVASPHGE